MTERVFDDRPQLGRLESRVVRCTPAKGGWDLRLEATIFFPRGGGQPCEGGTIGEAQVLDVFYDEAGDILHRVDRPVPEGPVEMKIRLDKRLEHSQQHTAQHLLSAVMEKLFGDRTVIARFEEEDSHIEVEQPLTPEQLAQVLAETRKLIQEDLPVRCFYVTPEEAAKLPVRGKITPHARIRLVQIGDYDLNACGGTHLSSLGQIGLLRFTGTKEVRGVFRIYFRAGVRCADYIREAELALLQLGQLAGTHSCRDTVTALTERCRELEALTEKERRLRSELEDWQRSLIESGLDRGRGTAVLNLPACEPKPLHALCEQICKERPATLVLGIPGDRPVLMLVRSKGPGPDLGAALRQVLEIVPGKGGGSPIFAQATLEPGADLLVAMAQAKGFLEL